MEMMKVRRGVPQYLITQNLNAARTVSTTNVWPGGDTGLALTGTNTLLGLWDGGDVLTNHQEFTNVTARVIDRDGATTVSGHSTHVAGTLAARGTVPVAHGMSAAASILAYDWTDDFQEMTDEVAANPLRVSNHSYGFARGWWYWEYQGQL
jgi:alkyl hydroperoxide reductase subunit AhpF